MVNLSLLKEQITPYIKQAGARIRDTHSSPVHEKAGHYNFVTDADVANQEYLREKLSALLDRLSEPGQKWPLYDRRIHNPVEEAVEIRESILIVEGNWLLLDEAPWNALSCDYSIFLRMGDRSQLERIVQRKMMGGYSEVQARVFVEQNDWPNIQRCMLHSRRGDLNLEPDENGLLQVV